MCNTSEPAGFDRILSNDTECIAQRPDQPISTGDKSFIVTSALVETDYIYPRSRLQKDSLLLLSRNNVNLHHRTAMPPIDQIRKSNADLKDRSYTAVFIGATSGVGLGAIRALLKNSPSSKLYIVGRSEAKFASTLVQLQAISTTARLTFLQAQVSLLSEVRRVCSLITTIEPQIDILWLSQGGLNMSMHTLTPGEGLFTDLAINYFSRMTFMKILLPQLNASKQPGGARVVSVFTAGYEGPINIDDIGLKKPKSVEGSVFKTEKHGVAMTSLAMKQIAEENPNISFIHTFPGFVATPVHDKWGQTMTGIYAPLGWLLRYVVAPVTHTLFALTPEYAGEVGIYEATSERFGAQGEKGSFYRLAETAEDVGSKGKAILDQYEEDGTKKLVWDHTLSEIERVLGKV